MEVKAEYLQQRYNAMETEELIELHRKGGLTEVASVVLKEILRTRELTDDMRAELTTHLEDTVPLSTEKRVSQDVGGILKTKWLKIWNYFCLPINSIINIYIAFTSPDISLGLIATILAIVQFSTALGLHLKKLWAWRLNWIALLINYYAGVTLPRFIKQSYGYEEPGTQLTLRIIIGVFIWIWPNYIYWKKRKDLFT